MKKLCNFRLETTLIKELDKLPGNRTGNVVSALQQYLQCKDNDLYKVEDLQQEIKQLTNELADERQKNPYDFQYVNHLEKEIEYLNLKLLKQKNSKTAKLKNLKNGGGIQTSSLPVNYRLFLLLT